METLVPYYKRFEPLCHLADLAQPHTLDRLEYSDELTPSSMICYICKGEISQQINYYSCYYCCICDLKFHFDCELPEIRHPFHPSHLLTLISLDLEVHSCNDDDDDDDDGKHAKCKCCRKRLEDEYYHCSVCKLSFNASCTRNQPPLTITPPKIHEHALTVFPRRLPLPCDACGLSLDEDDTDHIFECHPCNYMVHGTCIYLPRVIKITRHSHRLSFTSSLPPGDYSCGVCRKTVDINYGQYSCTKGCHYAIHSKCATRDDVWDGKDLEGVPEDSTEDIEPFVKIDENTIQHFSHGHYMRLHKNWFLGNQESKLCDACILQVLPSDPFYRCMQCEYVLHETCANLPRKKSHPLHKHPLTLHPTSPDSYQLPPKFYVHDMFTCYGCQQLGCGECMRCKSLSNSFFFLECVKSKSFLCLTCANVPSVVHYKYDSHLLTLCYGEEDATNLKYWCEICESILDPKIWFYTCDSCRVTLHVTCLLGLNMYLKPLVTIKSYNHDEEKMEIVRNCSSSRPVCDHCAGRCVDSLVFKCSKRVFCTLDCMHASWIDMEIQ
ncbi:hypothetical protein CARUB_v10004518mg [Capsella rubella]|uniref:Phorbol-ester/DAG-type domain-containing protein n=1 Tax=Capsella rubella TaxID=81985 RepID=R0GYW0_9BRAS|nr:hypothetical protein CARUB_v10004518mg [Capsella rubella]